MLIILSNWLAFNQILNPLLMAIILVVQIATMVFTKFNEINPSPWLHFNRTTESLLLFGNPLASIFYYFTYISEGFTSIALIHAQIMVLFCFYNFFFVLLSGIPFLGIYFAIRILFNWAGLFISQLIGSNYPIIVSPGIIIFFLMGLGVWFTETMFFYATLIRKESMGERTSEYQYVGKILFIIKILIGFAFILLLSLWIQNYIELFI